ncbi:MAG: TetR/AcrR family transcriptional regulator [Acidobacteria bacterium]|nr:TetR/AcrR family transcriptional regulator [Acidobacteriota bacterium]
MSVRMPAAQRRSQLLQVALDVFAAEGYHATSMNQLAQAAGVTKPVLYQHWDSKHELFAEILTMVGAELWARITAATEAATTPRTQVGLGFEAFFGFFAESPAAFGLMFGDGVRADPVFAEVVRRVEQNIAESIADLIAIEDLDPSDRRMLASGIVGLAEGAVREAMRREISDPSRVATQVAELAWAGLRGA